MNKLRKIFLAVLMLVCCFSVSSCQEVKGDHLEESKYMIDLEYKEDFKVLQLSDLHIANKDDRARQYEFLQETIDMANAEGRVDLIVLSGDLFTFATKDVAREMFAFFDKQEINWTCTFGNHDEQCYFSIDWLTTYLNNLTTSGNSYCKFIDNLGDDVYGNANFVLNLKDGNTIKEQIFILDTNRYHYGFDYIGYDYLRPSQIEWYQRMVNYTKTLNGGNVVKSIIYMHIPVPEYNDAWAAYENGEVDMLVDNAKCGEPSSSPDYNSGFFTAVKDANSSIGMFVGHDHINNWVIKYDGIILGYTVNSTDRIYFDEDLLGGTVYTLNLDKYSEEAELDTYLGIHQIIRSYDEYR